MALIKKGNKEIVIPEEQLAKHIADGWVQLDPATGNVIPSSLPKSYDQIKHDLDVITGSHKALMKAHEDLSFRHAELQKNFDNLDRDYEELRKDRDLNKAERDKFYAMVNGYETSQNNPTQAAASDVPTNIPPQDAKGKQEAPKAGKQPV